MDKEPKSAVENFLSGIEEGEKSPFDVEQKETVTEEGQTKTETEGEEGNQSEKLPFHKDPKVQKYVDKRISEALESVKSNQVESAPKVDTSNDEVVDVLTELIGNDTPQKVAMVKRFQGILEKGTQRAKEEVLREINTRYEEEANADRQAEEELSNAFENIEETYDVDISSNNSLARKTREEFITFVEKIAPKDREGNIVEFPDMTSAWETFSEIRKSTATPNRAKELANRGMAKSSETVSKPQGRVSWEQADNFIESLGK